MPDQLPTPLTELLVLHLYLSSVTLLLSPIIMFIIMGFKKPIKWIRYIIAALIVFLFAILFSFLIWMFWPFDFDFMIGPFNLPTLASLLLILGVYAIIKPNSISNH